MKQTSVLSTVFVYLLAISLMTSITAARQADQEAKDILEAAGVKGGFVVHIGCGDGHLTAALHANESYAVHGLDKDAGNIELAREHNQIA